MAKEKKEVMESETPRACRTALIKKIEEQREGRLLVCYITSTRPGYDVQIGDDVLPMLHHSLETHKTKAKKGVDLFIHSNGGSGTAPWRIVNLIREYTKNFTVIVPHHAFSAATLIALGADKIIMHKMGCLGPIDPSVTNPFNPGHPQNPGQLIPISVEDVSAYFTLIKDDVGVQHEDELIRAVIALTDKIHPLALGNVQRSHQQSRMIAKKLLRKHMPHADQEHEIDKLIENLKSNLYFHGHPINREEAKADLKLKVESAPDALEPLIWELYEQYAKELQLTERFNANHEWDARQPPQPAPGQQPAPLTTQEVVAQMVQMAQAGLGLQPGISEQQIVNLAVAMIPHVSGAAPGPGALAGRINKVRLDKTKGAYYEDADSAYVFLTDLTIERDRATMPTGAQDMIKQEILWQRWEIET